MMLTSLNVVCSKIGLNLIFHYPHPQKTDYSFWFCDCFSFISETVFCPLFQFRTRSEAGGFQEDILLGVYAPDVWEIHWPDVCSSCCLLLEERLPNKSNEAQGSHIWQLPSFPGRVGHGLKGYG